MPALVCHMVLRFNCTANRYKRRVVEAERLLNAHELAERVCAAFGCPHYEHMALPEKVP